MAWQSGAAPSQKISGQPDQAIWLSQNKYTSQKQNNENIFKCMSFQYQNTVLYEHLQDSMLVDMLK
jgi:hypothetical protein